MLKKSRSANRRRNLSMFIFKREKGCCFYCGKFLQWENRRGRQKREGICKDLFLNILSVTWNLDHIIPVKNQGKYNKNNLVLCCSNCNYVKGSTNIHPISKTPIDVEDVLKIISERNFKEKNTNSL